MDESLIRRCFAAVACLMALSGAPAVAHHGSAAYDTDRDISVRGRVVAWRWTQPHTTLALSAVRPDGGEDRWELEGPPLSWARQRGWSANTLQAGEVVEIVLYPSRSDAHAGLVKRIVRASGNVLPVSRPWLSGG